MRTAVSPPYVPVPPAQRPPPRWGWGGGLLMGLALAGALSAVSAQLVVNVTPSLPRGLYWRRPVGALAVGDVVEVTAPDRWMALRSPLPETLRHRPLLKHVAALAGSTVCWTPEAMTVPLDARPQRWPILASQAPTTTTCQVLGPDDLALVGTHPRSLDSRVGGLVHRRRVLYRVLPVLTWGGGA